MKRKGLTPAAVMGVGAFAIWCFLVARGVTGGRVASSGFDWPAILGEGFCSLAYLIGLISCWRAAALYPKNSPIGLGWLAMGGNCFLSIFRHLALNPLFARLLGSQDRVFLVSQSLQLPALIFVLLGMAGIWWGVYRLGLGFRVRWLDCAGIALAAGLIAWASRSSLSLANSGHGGVAILQAVSLGLLIAIGGVGLLLHGLALQMGGGRLAAVVRWIAVYALARSALTLTQWGRESFSLFWWLAFFSVPWIFAFGAAYSCWMADSVKRGIGKKFYLDWDVSGRA